MIEKSKEKDGFISRLPANSMCRSGHSPETVSKPFKIPHKNGIIKKEETKREKQENGLHNWGESQSNHIIAREC